MHLGVKTIRPVWSICHHLPSASERIGFLSLDKTRQLEQMHAWEVHALLCSIDIWCQYKDILWISEGDTLGVRFFIAFCNHWHCTCAMVLSLLCNHWQFRLVFLQWLNKNKIQKKQETKNTKKTTTWQDPTLCHYSPLGVCNLVFFFCFLFFFVS